MSSCRPWEDSALLVPGPSGPPVTPGPLTGPIGSPGIIYNRIVNVYRMQSPDIAPGQDPYGGETPAQETLLFPNLPAAITLRSPGRQGKSTVPTDISVHPQWVIAIPATAISLYDIRDRDIVIDDENYRYGVGAAVWALGYVLECTRLEV